MHSTLLFTLSLLLLTSCQVGISVPTSPENQNSDAINGALIAAQIENHQQSPLKATDRDLDWAIDGVGYFSVIDPESRETYFTRQGQFQQNADGQLVTKEGFLLDPPFTTPADAKKVLLTEGGNVWIHTGDESNWQNLGHMLLARFAKPENLTPHPTASGFFEYGPTTGEPEFGQTAQNGYGMTLSGVLEDFSLAATAIPDVGCHNAQPQQATERILDWAIDGKGYFTFLSPVTGEVFLTRQARLQVNPNGQLVSEHGYFLDPGITLPLIEGQDNASSFVRIDPDGSIWVRTPEEAEKRLGHITLALLQDPNSLKPIGFSRNTIHRTSPGNTTYFQPGENGLGLVKSNTYENCGQDIINRPLSFLNSVVSGSL